MDADCVSRSQQWPQGLLMRDQFSAAGGSYGAAGQAAAAGAMAATATAAAAATQFQSQSSIQHLCNHTCAVAHEFGNVFRCLSSGMLHVCDANCASRVFRDPYSSICLISKKIHAPLPQQQDAAPVVRKRGCSCSQDGGIAGGVAKRLNAGSMPMA